MIISLWIIYFAVIYALLFIAYTGWGHLFFPLIRAGDHKPDNFFIYTWTGWASSLLIFQIINLLLPLTPILACSFFIIGLTLSVRAYYISETTFSSLLSHRYFFIAVLLFALWTASHALVQSRLYDTGLYHLNAVRWLNEYAIVPGLGNLHGRLAFNMTSFFYVASLNCFPPFNIGLNLANSFLVVLLFAECFYPICLRFQKKSGPTELEILIKSALLPLILAYSINWTLPASSPDLCSGILRIVLFYNFILILTNFKQKIVPATLVNYLLFMAVTAVTVKLTNAMYSLTLVLICVLLCIMRRRNIRVLEHKKVLILFFVLLATWMGRGIVLSGYPLYPSGVFGVDTEWAVSAPHLEKQVSSIKGYRKSPGNKDISDGKWFIPWIKHQWSRDYLYFYVTLSVILTTVYTSAWLFQFRKGVASSRKLVVLIAIVPYWASLVFWCIMSPGMRFAWPFPHLLCLASAFPYFVHNYNRRSFRLAAMIILPVTINLPMFDCLIGHRDKVDISLTEGAMHHQKPALKIIYTNSSLRLYTPKQGNQCWDSPLPCTPYPNEKLRLRKDSIQSGFVLE